MYLCALGKLVSYFAFFFFFFLFDTDINLCDCIYTGTTAPLHLGRDPPLNECDGVSLTCQQCEPFPRRTFIAQEDATFVAVIGPSANPRGYTAITGDQK